MPFAESVTAKLVDRAIATASKAGPLIVALGIGTLAGAWTLNAVFHVPGPHQLSPLELLGRATRAAGYGHPRWLTTARGWIRDPSRRNLVGFGATAAGVLACLAGSSYGENAALGAWALFLAAVEGLGAGTAIRDAAGWAMVIVVLMGIMHLITRKEVKEGTWLQALAMAGGQMVLIPLYPVAFSVFLLDHLAEVWMLPTERR